MTYSENRTSFGYGETRFIHGAGGGRILQTQNWETRNRLDPWVMAGIFLISISRAALAVVPFSHSAVRNSLRSSL